MLQKLNSGTGSVTNQHNNKIINLQNIDSVPASVAGVIINKNSQNQTPSNQMYKAQSYLNNPSTPSNGSIQHRAQTGGGQNSRFVQSYKFGLSNSCQKEPTKSDEL